MGIIIPPYRVGRTDLCSIEVAHSQSPANINNLTAPLTTSRKRNFTVVK